MSLLTITVVTALAVLAGFAVAGFILVRAARKRGIRLRDLIGSGAG